jgi:hypothetical protein
VETSSLFGGRADNTWGSAPTVRRKSRGEEVKLGPGGRGEG